MGNGKEKLIPLEDFLKDRKISRQTLWRWQKAGHIKITKAVLVKEVTT